MFSLHLPRRAIAEPIHFVQLVGFQSFPRDLRMFSGLPFVIALFAEWIVSSASILELSPFGHFNKWF